MTARTRLVDLLLFGSGLCALIYQTTWLREFRLVFGVSTAATAAVVGIFMAGMGLGGIFLGRRSERAPHPLRFYAKLEFGIAIAVACSPILILAVRYCYNTFHDPRASQANRDLENFMQREGSAVDVDSLAREIQARAANSGNP